MYLQPFVANKNMAINLFLVIIGFRHKPAPGYRAVDKAPRLSISIAIWILSSDTDTICQLNQFITNSEAAMLSTEQRHFYWDLP